MTTRIIQVCDQCQQEYNGATLKSGNRKLFSREFCSPECLKAAEDED